MRCKSGINIILLVTFAWMQLQGFCAPFAINDSIYPAVNLPPYMDSGSKWVDSMMHTLTLEEKIAQSFMVVSYSDKAHENTKETLDLIRDYKVGGIIFLKGSPTRQAMITNQYQEASDVPLLIAMDAEWGLAMRLDSTIKYPEQLMLGAVQDNRLVYHMGRQIALQLKRIGVHINFAPVADVNNNPANPVINSRSFGENRDNVVSHSIAYMLGLQDNHILATAKHFPGHGDTETDSHKALPVISHSRERLDSIELYPFRQLINLGVGGIMTAHLNVPSLDTVNGMPTSLSETVINHLLREQMGYKGIVVSDALNMQGVLSVERPGDIELQAYKAGNDVLLIPGEIPKSIAKIKRAVRRDEISMSTVNEKCRRILSLKAWVGLDDYKPVDLQQIVDELNKPSYYHLNRKLNEEAMTLLTNKDSLLPLSALDTLKIACVAIGRGAGTPFQSTLSNYTRMDHFQISKDAGYEPFYELYEMLSPYNLIISSVHHTNRWPSRNFGLTNNTIAFLDSVAKHKTNISCIFANPYSLDHFNRLNKNHALIMGYEDTPDAQMAAAELIFGGINASGKLPVTTSEEFPVNQGIQTDTITRLKYSFPEEVGIPSESLKAVDSIVNHAIYHMAAPGCQVLMAKDGVVFYHKAFGHHTYQEETAVTEKDLYDLASITKIAATLPALMHFQDSGKFSIADSLGTYLPELEHSNKSGLIIEDILTHQARLKPWIPFYFSLFKPLYKDDPLFSRQFSKNYPFQLDTRSFLNKHYTYKEGYLFGCNDESHDIQVANNLYISRSYRDTIFDKISESELQEGKGYLYSDLGYYYFYKVIERIAGQPMEAFLDSLLYRPLGCNSTAYLPLEKYEKSRIVPTENDQIFRNQMLRGYVHDPGAAMLGGVCGHAGLFSNANDLAKIMQMYLNKGVYGGKRYFNQETIELFTSCPNCESGNRRGIGFDKPEGDEMKISPTCPQTPLESYGHTGFTGTMAWVDPVNDFIYIFLSNRIHPEQFNRRLIKSDIRTKIQEVFYNSVND